MKFRGVLIAVILLFCSVSKIQAAEYFVSTSGNDSDPGTQAQPFRTFSKATSVLQPGDILNIVSGTYQENVVMTRSGTASQPIIIRAANNQKVSINGQNQRENLIDVPASYVTVSGIEVMNSSGYCTSFTGQYITVSNLTVHDCEDHGIYADGQHIVIEGNTVHHTNLENQARNKSSGWGSAIKLRVGADDVIIRNNTVYYNYGEGIAATRARNVQISDNRVYDNFAVNIYVDNSSDISVERNFVTCEDDTAARGFYRDGHSAHAIALAEEQYDGWGAQLRNVTVKNNITAFCHKSLSDFGADVSGGGLDNVLVAYNTFWGSTDTAIALESEAAKTRNTRFLNNIIQQPNGDLITITRTQGITFDYNFWMSSQPDVSAVQGAHDKVGNVQFAVTPNYTAASFRLSASSLAINGALTIAGITDDYERKNRFALDQGSDIGAIEFGAALTGVPTPTPTATITIVPTATRTPTITPSPTPPTGYCAGMNIYSVTGDVNDPNNWILLTMDQLYTLQPGQTIYVSTVAAPPTVIFSRARIKVSVGTVSPVVYNQSESTTLTKPGTLVTEFYRPYTLPANFASNQVFQVNAQVYAPAYDSNVDPWDTDEGWR